MVSSNSALLYSQQTAYNAYPSLAAKPQRRGRTGLTVGLTAMVVLLGAVLVLAFTTSNSAGVSSLLTQTITSPLTRPGVTQRTNMATPVAHPMPGMRSSVVRAHAHSDVSTHQLRPNAGQVQLVTGNPGPSSMDAMIVEPNSTTYTWEFGLFAFLAIGASALASLFAFKAYNSSIVSMMALDTKSIEEDPETADLYAMFSDMLGDYSHNFQVGDVVEGTVFTVDDRGAYVDIGAKGAGWVPNDQVSINPNIEARDVLVAGTIREFRIISNRKEISLSMRYQEEELAWSRLKAMQAENITLQGKVISANRGGVLVNVENMMGFVPSSHLQRVNVQEIFGNNLDLKILEIDEDNNRLVMSHRLAQTQTPIQNFKVGAVVEGQVDKIMPFGAFVDLGGNSGLLHISQISHERVNDVNSVLSPGDKIKVMILTIDKANNRIALTTRKLEPKPGDMLKNPQMVYEKADEMAALFQERMAAALEAVKEQEEALSASMEEAQGMRE